MSDNHQNTDIASPTMSVNRSLRDRIAAVLSQHDVNLPDKVADAVIRELQTPQPCRNCGCPLVRDWTPDV